MQKLVGFVKVVMKKLFKGSNKMSVEKYNYLGVYVKGKLKNKNVPFSWRGCSNEACLRHDHGYAFSPEEKFCQLCASPIEEFSKEIKEYYDFEEIEDDYYDEYKIIMEYEFIIDQGDIENEIVLMCNETEGKFNRDIDDGIISIVDIKPKEAIKKFQDKYSQFLKHMEKYVDDISIDFGIVIYRN